MDDGDEAIHVVIRREYSAAELRDAELTMTALIREFNRHPVPGVETEQAAALLNGCDLRALVLMFVGAFRELAVAHATLTAAVAGNRTGTRSRSSTSSWVRNRQWPGPRNSRAGRGP